MELLDYAKRELKAAGFYEETSDYGGMLPQAVLELIEVFSKQGHSGGSAAITLSLFAKLAAFKPLAPISGQQDEWVNTDTGKDKESAIYQNNRLSALFKVGENGRPHYLHAIVWKGEEPGNTFTGTVEGITSRQYVRFPFTPKTFYVDVVKHYDIENYPEHDVVEGAGKYVYTIKDHKQLDEVYAYYDSYEIAE